MRDGTEQSPFTSEDVLRLIQENGGKVEGIDLSGKHFENGIDLRQFNLAGLILKKAIFYWQTNPEEVVLEGAHLEGANLSHAHLEEAFLRDAHLEGAKLRYTHLERAKLWDAYLEGAVLEGARLEGADLGSAHLQGAILLSAEFSADTGLENVDWGNYILGDESMGFDIAADTYRRLKQWYTNAGMYDIAGKFFYREMEAKRKAQSWKKEFKSKLWSWVMRLLCGYGEKPENAVISAAAVILVCTFIYFGSNSVWEWYAFWRSLYFSVASFTTSAWIDEKVIDVNSDLIRGLGVTESFIGVFMMALFLVTFTRKMTR